MDGRLFVFGTDVTTDHAYMMSFEFPENEMSDIPSGQRIDMHDRVMQEINPRNDTVCDWK